MMWMGEGEVGNFRYINKSVFWPSFTRSLPIFSGLFSYFFVFFLANFTDTC